MSLPLNQRGFSHDNTHIWTLLFMPQHHLSCYGCLPSRLEFVLSPGHLQRPEEVHPNQVWWKNSCFGKVPHGLGVSPSNTMFLACSIFSALIVMQCGTPSGINVLPSIVSLSRSMLATGISYRIWQKPGCSMFLYIKGPLQSTSQGVHGVRECPSACSAPDSWAWWKLHMLELDIRPYPGC